MKRTNNKSDLLSNPFFQKGGTNDNKQDTIKPTPSAAQGRSDSPDLEIIDERKPTIANPNPTGTSNSGTGTGANVTTKPTPAKRPPLRIEFYDLAALTPITPVSGKNGRDGRTQRDERPGETCRKVRYKSTTRCFNCCGPHTLNDCTLEHDPMEIAKNSRIYRMNADKEKHRQRPPTPVRYMDAGLRPENEGPMPGVISAELRQALQLRRNELPKYIYKMREFGYPPGHLEKAKIYSSGLSFLDADGSSNEQGWTEPEVIYVDETKMYSYPGFNGPMPPGVTDEYEKHGAPQYDPHQNIDLYHQEVNELYACIRKEKEQQRQVTIATRRKEKEQQSQVTIANRRKEKEQQSQVTIATRKRKRKEPSSGSETDFSESEEYKEKQKQKAKSSKRARMELNMSTASQLERPNSASRSGDESSGSKAGASPFRDYSMLFNPFSQKQDSRRPSSVIGSNGQDLSDSGRFLPNPAFGLEPKLASNSKRIGRSTASDKSGTGSKYSRPVKRRRAEGRTGVKMPDVITLEDDDDEEKSLPPKKRVRMAEPIANSSSSSSRLVNNLNVVRPSGSGTNEANSQGSQKLSGDVSYIKGKGRDDSQPHSQKSDASSRTDKFYIDTASKNSEKSPEKGLGKSHSRGNTQKSETSSGSDKLDMDANSNKSGESLARANSKKSDAFSGSDRLYIGFNSSVMTTPKANIQTEGSDGVLPGQNEKQIIGSQEQFSQEKAIESPVAAHASPTETTEPVSGDSADKTLAFDPNIILYEASNLDQTIDESLVDDEVTFSEESFVLDTSRDKLYSKMASIFGKLTRLDKDKEQNKSGGDDKKSPSEDDETQEEYINPFTEFPTVEKFAEGMDDLILPDVQPPKGKLLKVLYVIRRGKLNQPKPIADEKAEPPAPGT